MRALAFVAAVAACGTAPEGDPPRPRDPAPVDLLARIPAAADGVIALDAALGIARVDAPRGIVVRARAVDDAPGSFAAVRISPALRAQLPSELAELQWVALSLSPARVLRGTAMWSSPDAAAKLAIDLGMVRKLAMTQLPAPLATALDKVAVTAWGPAVMISATWTAADVAALSAAAR